MDEYPETGAAAFDHHISHALYKKPSYGANQVSYQDGE